MYPSVLRYSEQCFSVVKTYLLYLLTNVLPSRHASHSILRYSIRNLLATAVRGTLLETCCQQLSAGICPRRVDHSSLFYSVRELLSKRYICTLSQPCQKQYFSLLYMRLPTYSSLCYCGLVTYIQVSGIITNQNIMAEKVFLNRKRAIPIAETHSISREDIPSTTRNIAVSEKLLFRIWYQTSKSFPKFNATGYDFLIKFNSPL